MIDSQEHRSTRRAWLVACGRNAMAAAIALLALVLALGVYVRIVPTRHWLAVIANYWSGVVFRKPT